jgi:hypothetical protein
VSLLEEAVAILRQRGITHAVIGAAALAVHGVSRATADLDLLVIDIGCLDARVWQPLTAQSVEVEIRHGDADDPLAGVIRIARRGEGSIDLIVGRHAWQRECLARAEARPVGSVELPVVRAADLLLLKLYAGGPQDAWDIDQLLDLDGGMAAEVEERLGALPEDCTRLWRRILSEHGRAR